MKRREFVVGVGAATACPRVAWAQQLPLRSRPLVGFLGGASFERARPTIEPWLEGMRALGYVPERTVDVEYRFAEGDNRRLPQLAQDLARLKPDVILAATAHTAVAAAEAAPNIPIVCPLFGDLISSKNDARPERNITGVRESLRGLGGKLIDLAQEMVPGAKRIGVLVNGTTKDVDARLDDVLAAAQSANIAAFNETVFASADFDGAFRKFAAERVDASIVHADSLFFAERVSIARIAAELRIPTVYGIREHVVAGGLASYGVDFRANFRRAATYVAQLLKGARVADLPIEFPTAFLLTVNVKAAKALRLTIPPTLLARADEVIE